MMTTMCRGNSQGDKRWQQVSNATERVKLRLCVQNISRHGIEMKCWGGIWKQKCHWRNWTGGIWKIHFSVTWWMMQFTSNHCCFVSTILVYMYSIPMRSTSRPTQSSDCLVPLDLLLSLHNPTVTSDKENTIVPSGLAQHLGPWLFVFILYIFIQASPNCITTNPTVSVFTACSIAWDEVFRHMDQGNRDAGVGQFLVNIKSNCFSTLGVTEDLDRGWWTFDVEGQLGESA